MAPLTTGLQNNRRVAEGNYDCAGVVAARSRRLLVLAIALFGSESAAGHAAAFSISRAAAAFCLRLSGWRTCLRRLREKNRVQSDNTQADRESKY